MAPHAEEGRICGNSNAQAQLPAESSGFDVKEFDDDMRMHEGSLELFNLCTKLHKASLITLRNTGILDVGNAKCIAEALERAAAEHDRPGAAASIDYLDFEKRMAYFIGPEASLLHLGRSRQDLLSAYHRLMLRNRTLSIMQHLIHSRRKLLQLASQHTATVIPMFTHGVPAQPTTFGHYLLGYAGALERSQERLFQTYGRLNISPYGVAVGTTSSFPIDRVGLAWLLGFDGVIENSFDANHVASVDVTQDVISPLTTLALHVGSIAQDMTTVQATAHPWLATAAPGFTGVSSIMPQKRNPRILEYIRETASEIVSGSHMATIMAHNTTSGLTDVRETFQKLPLNAAIELLELFSILMDSVRIDAEQAMYQVSQDYSTITEVVDVLYSTCRVPFRKGHNFASRLVDYGRCQHIGAPDIGYVKAAEIYLEVTGDVFPMTEDQLRGCLDPAQLVQHRRGRGGPQKEEALRMLIDSKKRLDRDAASLQRLLDGLREADVALHTQFTSLR